MRKYFLLLALLLLACSPQVSQRATFYVFGTTVEIILPDTDKKTADFLFGNIQTQLMDMHKRWHAWEPSELTEINSACIDQTTITITPETKTLILLAQHYEQQTLGYFNPAIGGLIGKWGFLSDFNEDNLPSTPTESDLAQAVTAKPSMYDLHIDHLMLTCNNPQVRLDFGAFAKGYASGQIMHYLQSQGVRNALINAGGDVQTLGKNHQHPWQVAVYIPGETQATQVFTLTNNESVFTSGTYARAFSESHHHLIDPKTGYPAETWLSVTVIHPDPVLADAAATALLIAGEAHWKEIMENLNIDAVLLVDKQGQKKYLNTQVLD